jgi:hypothetical protein
MLRWAAHQQALLRPPCLRPLQTKKRKHTEGGGAAHDPATPLAAAIPSTAASQAGAGGGGGMHVDLAALLAIADAEAAVAAAQTVPVPVRTLSLMLSTTKEALEPSPCYKGVWRVVAGPRQGLFKAQISTPGRAGRPKRLDYFGSDIEAAECYDRYSFPVCP